MPHASGVVLSLARFNRIIAEEVSALGWTMDAAEAERRFIGLSWRNIVPLVEARLGPGSVPADFVDGVIARVLRALHEQVVPVPGALEAVRGIFGNILRRHQAPLIAGEVAPGCIAGLQEGGARHVPFLDLEKQRHELRRHAPLQA